MNRHFLPSRTEYRHWRSLDGLSSIMGPKASPQRELPQSARKFTDPVSRRHFVKIISATFLLAGLGPLAVSGRKAGEEQVWEAALSTSGSPTVRITIDPFCQRNINGISVLKRETYFSLNDPGTDFDQRCRSEERYDFLVKENGVSFGGTVNVVNKAVHEGAVKEDAAHPGFADAAYLKEKLALYVHPPNNELNLNMEGRLEVAAHEMPNAFPKFMGAYTLKGASRVKAKDRSLPANITAAAQLAADTLRWGYTDFDRPVFYEPVNEPAPVYWKSPHLAEWHLATQKAAHQEVPGVRVGGPCLSVAYFFRDQYRAFDGLKKFIDNTHCGLDFYSFHVYDFLEEKNGHFGGRITSGLPLESVIDLVENYTINTYGRKIGIVVSEHGGIGAKDLAESLARNLIPGSGFEWEMKKKSIEVFNMVSSAIANTLVFMDHPQTILKAVPFILLNAFAWNPELVDVLYVPRDFTNKSDWVPTQMIMFYRLFRDLRGHRVTGFCPDPDIQMRAFADGSNLFVIMNNLSQRLKTVALDLPAPQSMVVRRFGRHDDFTPYLTEQPLSKPRHLEIQPRETVVLKAEYGHTLKPRRAVNEVSFYGDRIAVAVINEGARFVIRFPNQSRCSYATLLIGVSRPPEAGWDVEVLFNGHPLVVPLEQCAERLVDKEYASCKLIPLTPTAIKSVNTIDVSFPDGRPGAVGAVVIRAGMQVPPVP